MTDIGERSDVVVIGGVAAGPKAAASIVRRSPKCKVTVFERTEFVSYGTCGMPYFASGDISSFEELTKTSWGVERSPEFFRQAKGFEVLTGAEVLSIDRTRRRVTFRYLGNDQIFEHGYDYLVLATGSVPRVPPFEVARSEIISHFTRPSDAIKFRQRAQTGGIGEAVIIGGGFIGCELAEATAGLWGIATTLIECESQLLPYTLDPEMAVLVKAELERQGVNVLTAARVEKVTAQDDRATVHYKETGGDKPSAVESDHVFLCTGVQANVDLAQESGLQVGPTGAIIVDQFMQTNDERIFAGGDCVESQDIVSGRRFYLPMGSLANRHGRVIAEQIAGDKDTRFPGVVGAFVVKVFDLNVGSVGLSSRVAASTNPTARAVWGAFSDRPDYYPEHESIVVKMLYDPEDMRLLGLQAVGKGDVCRRVDVFSSFLQHKATVHDLLNFEHCYAPPYNEALDPLHHLAGMALAQERGDQFISAPCALDTGSGDDVVWLDVREPDEIATIPLPNGGDGKHVLNIPLEDLKNRLGEIDFNRSVYIVCQRGPRSYQAARLLSSNGCERVRIVGGGTTAMGLSAKRGD